LVNPKDVKGLAKALLRLLRDEELSKRLGKRARKTVEENYSQEKIINEYIDLYCSLS
jgi:glycosyltransferase involved in cell wall biosynthesis